MKITRNRRPGFGAMVRPGNGATGRPGFGAIKYISYNSKVLIVNPLTRNLVKHNI
jgi:hypothetical protein